MGDRRGPETCHTAHQRGNQHLRLSKVRAECLAFNCQDEPRVKSTEGAPEVTYKSNNAPLIVHSCERNDHRLIITSILYCALSDEPATEGVHPIWRPRGGRAMPERSGGSPFPPRVCLRGKRRSSQMKYVDK